MTADEIINFFNMKPLQPEGGFYIETYRAAEIIKKSSLPISLGGNRNISTAILYLLPVNSISTFHRLKTDEIFHFYLGDPVTMIQLHPDGKCEKITLGSDILKGQKIQVLIPRGAWQGSFVNKGGKFALMGCTVAPGFDPADFEQVQRAQLLKKFPEHREWITKLT
jgi:predicted cupin superfamily sugar epimerase